MNGFDTPSTTVVVFERHSWWAPELERRFLDTGIRVRTCPRIRDLLAEPATVVVLHVDSSPAECLAYLGRRDSERVPCVAIVSDQTADLEWTIRELGATSVLHEYTSGDLLADVCRRASGMERTTID